MQVLHLINHEGVVRKEYVTPDDLEIGEKFAEALQTVHAIQKKVAGDLSQFRETNVLEIGLGIVLDQHDLKETLDHAAVPQYREEANAISDIYALTNAVRDSHVLVSSSLLASHLLARFHVRLGQIRRLTRLLIVLEPDIRRSGTIEFSLITVDNEFVDSLPVSPFFTVFHELRVFDCLNKL